MAQYDGSIRINTKIDTKDVPSQLMKLENSMQKVADKVSSLRSKMESLKDIKIPTQEYAEIQKQIEVTEKKINDLLAHQEKFIATGGKKSSSAYQKMQYDLDELRDSLPYLQGELQDLVDTGKAFTLGTDTEQYSKLGQELKYAENNLLVLNKRHDELVAKQGTVSERFSKMKGSAKKAFSVLSNGIFESGKLLLSLKCSAKKALNAVSSGTKKSNGLLSTFSSRLKGLALSLLIFNWISKAFNVMISGMKQGFTNFMNYSDSFANSVQGMKNAMSTLGNQFAAAFAPIVQMVIPWLTQLVNAISTAMTYIAQFIAILGGKSTFTRAKQVQDSYNKSLGGTASAAKKAYGALAKFDDLDVLQKKEDDAAGGAGNAIGDLFEEIPVDNNILDAVKKLKNILMQLFKPLKKAWEQEGKFVMKAWKYALDEIGKLIKDIGRDFLTMWNQEATVEMLSNILHIIGDIGLVIGNISHDFDEAWNKNNTGLHILENIRDIFAIIIQNIREAADFTAEWSKTLDFSPLLESIERLTGALAPFADFVSGTFADFYTEFLLPLASWTLSEDGIPRLINILGDFMDAVNWEALRGSLKNLYSALEPYAEAIGEGLIDFIEKIKDFGVNILNALPEPIQKLADALNSGDPEKIREWTTTILEFATVIEGLKLAFTGFKIVESGLSLFGIGGAASTVAITATEAAGGINLLSSAISGLISVGTGLGIVEALKGPIWDLAEAAGINSQAVDNMRERYLGLSGDLDLIKDPVSFLTNGFQGLGWEMSNSIGALGAFETAMNNIAEGMIYTDDKLSKMQKNFGFTSDDIETLRQEMLEAHPELRELADGFEGLNDASAETLQQIYTGLQDISNGMVSVDDVTEKMTIKFEGLTDETANFFQRMKEGADYVGYYKSAIEGASESTNQFVDDINKAGENIAEGVTQGFEKADVQTPVQNFFNIVKDTLASVFDMHSPAKNMEPFGENIILGILEGFKNKFSDFGNVIFNLMQNIQTFLASGNTQPIGVEMGNGILEGFRAKLQELYAWLGSEFMPMFIEEGILPWFSFEKWHDEILINIPLAFQTMWEELLVWWNDGAMSIWWEEYVVPWFTFDLWKLQFDNILLALEAVWEEILEDWKKSLDMWWENDVKPRFMLAKWLEMLKPVDDAYEQTFAEILNTINSKMEEAYNIVSEWTSQMMAAIQEVMAAIDGISSSLSSVSGTSFSVSGASIGADYASYSLDNIPHLASGSVIRGGNPFIAMLGDQRVGQTNIEAPAGLIEDMVKKGIREEMGNFQIGGGQIKIAVQVNGADLAQVTLDDFLSEMNRQGYNVDLLGYT